MSNEINEAAIVSCDIIAHGRERNHSKQLERIQAINDHVRDVCKDHLGEGIVWASGGDGGHIAFMDESLRGLTIRLIRNFFLWGKRKRADGGFDVRLRLIAHFGPVSTISGADNRLQLVGDGINFCGSLLKFGNPGGVVVSSAFKEFIDEGRQRGDELVDSINFHNAQDVYLKHFFSQRLYLMSFGEQLKSVRARPERSDYTKLDEACDSKRYWQIIYHAKRLLQVDSSNQYVEEKRTEHIKSGRLSIWSEGRLEFEAHPLFSKMSDEATWDFIKAAQLIEREDGEIICENKNTGDTMFIVLDGQVGVVMEPDHLGNDQGESGLPLDMRYGEGMILGELALALQRNRTATLQAIGPTALLSMNHHTFETFKEKSKGLAGSFKHFLKSRILEHICRKTTYLSCEEGGPLSDLKEPWEVFVDSSELIEFSWQEWDSCSSDDECFNQPGLYVLTSGRLIDRSKLKVLDGNALPILFVNMPNYLVNNLHNYEIEPNETTDIITILRIPDKLLGGKLGPKTYSELVMALMRQLSKQFTFDAFISYNQNDQTIAESWYNKMKEAKLQVYMHKPQKPDDFIPGIELAIAESLVMVPMISHQSLVSISDESWVLREIRFRKALFGGNCCNILPVELSQGSAAEFADGFTAIEVVGREKDAIRDAIETIKSVRDCEIPPPHAKRQITPPAL